MYKFLSLFTSVLLIIVACTPQKKAEKVSITQGISGSVVEEIGNRMPMVDAPASSPNPFETTVFVYELVNVKNVEPANNNGLYTVVNSKLITSVKTDAKGKFSINLPVGKYSLFVQKNSSFYANRFNAQNDINVYEVNKDALTTATIKVSLNAVY